MKITLGLGLDAAHPQCQTSSLGVKAVGPLGLLSILETQYGVAPITASLTTRIIHYQRCLLACDHAQRFYHASFAVDQFNVAKTLLHWRDTWYEAGWQGSWTGDLTKLPLRLKDLAEVETLAQEQVAWSLGQRLQHILSLLPIQKSQITEIALLEPLTEFPPLWQRLLSHFRLQEQPALTPSASGSNDLVRVQQALANLAHQSGASHFSKSVEKIPLAGDESFIILRAQTKNVSAAVIADWLKHERAQTADKTVAVLASEAGYLLDDALNSADLPRLGFEHISPWRPVLQLLPITLALFWEPLNPAALLQFLLHPVGILPGRIRYPLADVVAEAPGIGGEKWQATLTRLLAKECEREDFTPERLQQLTTELDYWFASERFTPTAGLPLSIAITRVAKLRHWLAQQQALRSDAALQRLFGIAQQQASELKTALGNLSAEGNAVILPEQLHYLLQQLSGTSVGIPDLEPECLPSARQWLVGTTQENSFYTPVDRVIWWDLQAKPQDATYPWSRQEIQCLTHAGVLLPDKAQVLQQQAKQWLKPIFAARERVVIVKHDTEEAQHPLWDQLTSCLTHWREIHVEETLLQQDCLALLDALPTVPAPLLPLTPVSRWWQLDDGTLLSRRNQESYSSLEQFFFSPYQWVLRYKARLKSSTLQTLNDGNTLKGLLVHQIYQQFFSTHPQIFTTTGYLPETVDQWLTQRMSILLTEAGAVLLQPGRMIEKEQFIATARKSLHTLIRQLRAANVVDVQMELKQDALFFGGQLEGFIDMQVRNAQQQEALIDIKWGGLKYRKASLKENTHLQLVTYAYLRHKNSNPAIWPALAYFIIDNGGMLLTQDTYYFPDALAISPGILENQAEIWQRMQKTWEWRRAQLDQGLIEVTVQGTDTEENSTPGEEALAVPKHSDHFNSYRILTGLGD